MRAANSHGKKCCNPVTGISNFFHEWVIYVINIRKDVMNVISILPVSDWISIKQIFLQKIVVPGTASMSSGINP
jgi:hypothetical protein